MKIAIHYNKFNGSFSGRWLDYCKINLIDFKLVNCYSNDIIDQLADCDALMWHYSNEIVKDYLFSSKLLNAVEASGKLVFPDFRTAWYFDDKVAQKYLLESIHAPFVKTWVFYSRTEALQWSKDINFPKVFKQRSGAGSNHVKLIQTKKQAGRFINKAFTSGFSQYDKLGNLKERIRKYKNKQTNFWDVVKGVLRIAYPTDYSKIRGNEKGYVYFQEFLPDNKFDIRVIVIGDKAFAIKRMVRANDFRASGSGMIKFNKDEFDERCVRIAFEVNDKIKAQCIGYDFVFNSGKDPVIVEIGYGFVAHVYDKCTGYWTKDLCWHEGHFDPYGWMIDLVIKSVQQKNEQ